jgi:hypothetical protein
MTDMSGMSGPSEQESALDGMDGEGGVGGVGGVDLASVVRPVEGMSVEAFADATLVWDPNRSKLHHLDTMAAIVWDELDGRPLDTIATSLAAEFEANPAQVRDDVLALVRTLTAEGLLRAETT